MRFTAIQSTHKALMSIPNVSTKTTLPRAEIGVSSVARVDARQVHSLLHMAAVSPVDRIRFAASVARPFGLYSSIALCVIQIRLIEWLRSVSGERAEVLA